MRFMIGELEVVWTMTTVQWCNVRDHGTLTAEYAGRAKKVPIQRAARPWG